MTGDPMEALRGEVVVLDTATSIVYLGKLAGVTPDFFLLEEADMHDCNDGHAGKEVYLAEAARSGVDANRRHIAVLRSSVISLSKLSDIIAD